MAFDIHFRVVLSDIVLNVIRDEASIRLDVIGGVGARVVFDVTGDGHAGEVILVVKGDRSVIRLDNDGFEATGEGGKRGGRLDFNGIDAGGRVRHVE